MCISLVSGLNDSPCGQAVKTHLMFKLVLEV